MSETTASPTEQALESYARFLQRTKDMGIVGHRGGIQATRELLQMCDLRAGQRILEVGCGSGFTACLAAKEHEVGVVAADLEAHLLRRTLERARSTRQTDRVAPVRADGRRLPFPDACFDGVICESVLGFLEDKFPALGEFHRVLKPGGFLANHEVTFTRPPPDEFLAALRGAAPRSGGALAVPVDPQDHRRLLEETGFQFVTMETGDVSAKQNMMEQMQIDGFRALKWALSSLFNREVREAMNNPEMREAQATFDEHTGYGLYLARRATGA